MVGAGPAGLAAAWTLARAGASVTLYDERDEPGGRMRSDALEGCIVDPAVQLFGSTYSSIRRLAGDVGAAELIVRSPGRDAVWRNGKPHALTYGSVSSLVASSALPAGLKLRLATRYLPFLASEARRLDANDPARTGGAALDGRSVTEWGRTALGEDFVELLAYPLLGAYYGGTPEQISVALYHALAKVGTDVRVYGVSGGMGALSRALLDAAVRRGAQWRRGDAVRAVRAGPTDVTVVAVSGEREYDGVVVAVPAGPAASLLSGTAGEALAGWLARVRSAATATVALVLEGELTADYFGLSFPRATAVGDTVVVVCNERRKLPGLVPAGRSLLVAYPAPAVAAELAGAESAMVVDRVVSALESVYPRLESRIRHARVYRFPQGYTLFDAGYLKHIVGLRDEWLPARTALAGDYMVAPTVEGAVVSGLRAAKRLLADR